MDTLTNIWEIIKQFFASEEMSTLITTLVWFLVANFGVLLTLAVKLIKTKVGQINRDELYKQAEAKAHQLYNDKFNEYQALTIAKLEDLEKKVIGKITNDNEEKQQQIKEQSIKLENTLTEIKNTLSLDEVLNNTDNEE